MFGREGEIERDRWGGNRDKGGEEGIIEGRETEAQRALLVNRIFCNLQVKALFDDARINDRIND